MSRALAPARQRYGLGVLPGGKAGAEVEAASLGVPERGPGVGPVTDVVGIGPVGEGAGDGEALGDGDVGVGDGDVVGAVGSGEGVTVGPVDGDADGDA